MIQRVPPSFYFQFLWVRRLIVVASDDWKHFFGKHGC